MKNKNQAPKNHKISSKTLNAQIEKFLQSGGEIKEIERGVGASAKDNQKGKIVITPPSDISKTPPSAESRILFGNPRNRK